MRDRRFRNRFPFRFPTAPATKDGPCQSRPKGVSRSGKTPLPAPADYVWKGLRKRERIETETQVRQLQERPRRKPSSKLPPELAAAASWSPARGEHSRESAGSRPPAAPRRRVPGPARPAPCPGATHRARLRRPGGSCGPPAGQAQRCGPCGVPRRPRDPQLTC